MAVAPIQSSAVDSDVVSGANGSGADGAARARGPRSAGSATRVAAPRAQLDTAPAASSYGRQARRALSEDQGALDRFSMALFGVGSDELEASQLESLSDLLFDMSEDNLPMSAVFVAANSLPKGVNGAFVPGKGDKPGTLLISSDLKGDPGATRAVMLEGYGEAVAAYAQDVLMMDIILTEMGVRLAAAVSGKVPPASPGDQPRETITVRHGGAGVEAVAVSGTSGQASDADDLSSMQGTYAAEVRTESGWRRVALSLTGQRLRSLPPPRQQRLATLREAILEGDVMPEIRTVPSGALLPGETGTMLPVGVDGAYIAAKDGAPGLILLAEDLSPEQRAATLSEEYGEAVADAAQGLGLRPAAGDAGERISRAVSGEDVSPDNPATRALFADAPGDTSKVRVDGETVIGEAATFVGRSTDVTGAITLSGNDNIIVEVRYEGIGWVTAFDKSQQPDKNGTYTIRLPKGVAPGDIRITNATQQLNDPGNAGKYVFSGAGTNASVVYGETTTVGFSDRPGATNFNNVVIDTKAPPPDVVSAPGKVAYLAGFDGAVGGSADGFIDAGELIAAGFGERDAGRIVMFYGQPDASGVQRIAASPASPAPGLGLAGMVADGAVTVNPGARVSVGFDVSKVGPQAASGALVTAAARPRWTAGHGRTETVADTAAQVATGGMTVEEFDQAIDAVFGDTKPVNETTRAALARNFGAPDSASPIDGTALTQMFERGGITIKPGDGAFIGITVDTTKTGSRPPPEPAPVTAAPVTAATLIEMTPEDAAAALAALPPSDALDILAAIRDARSIDPSNAGRTLTQGGGVNAVVESFLATTVGAMLKQNIPNLDAIAGGALLGGVVDLSALESNVPGERAEQAIASVDTRSEMQASYGVATDWTSMSEPEVVLRLAAAPNDQAAVDLLGVIQPGMKAGAVASLATSAIPGDTGPGSIHRSARAIRVGDLIGALTEADQGTALTEVAGKDIDAAARIIGTLSPEAAAQAMKSLDPTQIAAILNRLAETGHAALAGGILASLSTLNPEIMARVEALLLPGVPRQTAQASPDPDPPTPPSTTTTQPDPQLPPVRTQTAAATGSGGSKPSTGNIPADAKTAKGTLKEYYETNGGDDFETLNTPRLGGAPAPSGPPGISDEAREIASIYQTEDGSPTQDLKSLYKLAQNLNSRRSKKRSAAVISKEKTEYTSAVSQMGDMYSDLERLRGRPLLSWETSTLIRETIAEFNVAQDRQTARDPSLYDSVLLPPSGALITLTTVRYSAPSPAQRSLSSWRNNGAALAQPGAARLERYMDDLFTRNGFAPESQGDASITAGYPADVTSPEAKSFLETEARKMEQAFGLPDYRERLIEGGVEQAFIDHLDNGIKYGLDFTIGESLSGMDTMRGLSDLPFIKDQRVFDDKSGAKSSPGPTHHGQYKVKVNLSNADSTAGALSTVWHELTHVFQAQTSDIYKAAISYVAQSVPPAQAQAKIEQIMGAFGVSMDYANLMIFQELVFPRSPSTRDFYRDSTIEGEAWEATWNFLDMLEDRADTKTAPPPS